MHGLTPFLLKTGEGAGLTPTYSNSISSYTNDIFGRLVKVDAPEGADARYYYNGLDQLTRAEVGAQSTQARTFTYNALGNALSAYTPERGTIYYREYDALGNLLKYDDPNGSIGGYSFLLDYDYKGRQTALKKSTGAGVVTTISQWAYDQDGYGSAHGKLCKTTRTFENNRVIEEEFYYNAAAGRLSEKKTFSLGHALNLFYEYDGYGNVVNTAAGLLSSNSTAVLSEYKRGMLFKRYFNEAGSKGAQNILYYPSGAIKEIWLDQETGYGPVKKIEYVEDSVMPRLKNIAYMNMNNPEKPADGPGDGIYDWATGDYSYDHAGNIAAIWQNSYVYDVMSRLKSAYVNRFYGDEGSYQTYGYRINYGYDDYGNLRSKNQAAYSGGISMEHLINFNVNPSETSSYYFNRINEVKFGTNSSYETILYDSNGNQTTLNGWGLTYTEDNLLKKAVSSDSITGGTEYHYYNTSGERLAKLFISQTAGRNIGEYYLKEGPTTLGELKYVYDGWATSSIREKYFLYVGGKLLATSEKETGVTVENNGGLNTNSISRKVCPNYYAQSNGIKRVVALSDPVVCETNGNKYDLSYSIENVTGDLVGAVVRIARIKDQGNGGNGGDNGNGCPRNDEDKIELRYFLKSGLDPDFVFKGFGLCGNQDYGTVVAIAPGENYPIEFQDLQKDKLYRVTLYAVTAWGADANIGYNLFEVEEGDILRPKKDPSTHMKVKTMTKEGSDGVQKTFFRAAWGNMDGVTGYNVVMKKLGGESVTINDAPITATSFEIETAVLETAGISLEGEFGLGGIPDDGDVLDLLEFPRGILKPIVCDLPPTVNYTVPAMASAYLFNQPEGYSSMIGYIDWNPGSGPAPYYKIYRKVDSLNHVGTFAAITTTQNSYYVDENISTYATNVTYKVEPLGTDMVAVASASYPKKAAVINSYLGMTAVNIASGDGSRAVKIDFSGNTAYFTPDSGFSVILRRAYSPDSTLMECGSFADEDFTIRQIQYDLADYTDTDFLPSHENPLVAYKAEINFKNLFVLAETGCVWTHVSYCSEPPVITSATATYEGETDSSGCAVVKVAWTLAQPSTTTLFAVTPCATVGDYDPYGSFAKKTTACLPDQTHVTYYVQPRDTATGCLGAAVSADAQVPACNTYTCPTTTGVIETTVTVIGPADSAGTNVNIQLVWGGSVGETTYIYRNDNGICTTSESYLYATIDDGSTSFEDTIPSGTLIKYKILSRTNCAGTDYTVGASNCIEVMTGPVTGQGSGTTHYYLTDHLGTVRAILDENGTVLSTHDYEPFGTELEPFSSDLTENKYKYTGQERDYDTGMDYMHFRYYASTMGRFMKPDNMIPNAANPQSWNLYSYVNGNPVNFNDPTGHDLRGTQPHGMGMSQALMAPPGGTIWDMAMNSTYVESIGGWYVSYSDWASSNDNVYAESAEKVAQFRLSDMTGEDYLGDFRGHNT